LWESNWESSVVPLVINCSNLSADSKAREKRLKKQAKRKSKKTPKASDPEPEPMDPNSPAGAASEHDSPEDSKEKRDAAPIGDKDWDLSALVPPRPFSPPPSPCFARHVPSPSSALNVFSSPAAAAASFAPPRWRRLRQRPLSSTFPWETGQQEKHRDRRDPPPSRISSPPPPPTPASLSLLRQVSLDSSTQAKPRCVWGGLSLSPPSPSNLTCVVVSATSS